MSDEIVTVAFSSGNIYYAIYRGYDGKILDWFDLNAIIPLEKHKVLSDATVQQLKCDGTALFIDKAEARKVMEAME